MNINRFKAVFMVITLSFLCGLSQTAMSVGNLTVTKEVSLKASPATVWKMIGGFNALDVWHPVVVDSQLEVGEGIKPGDIRILSLGNGAEITEKLVVYSDVKKTYTYAITESPLPVMDYVSTISVSESESGMSKVEWSSTFNANNAPDEKAIETIAGVYDAGLSNLAKHFNQ
jgi:polyketide cyclase/dehydrase/lipid transport protein